MPLPSTRTKARKLLVQALYQWQVAGADIREVEVQFFTDNDMKNVDTDYFRELLHQIPAQLDVVDNAYAPLLDRKPEDLDPVSKTVLRIGAYELVNRIDIPYKVVINESVNLAKKFGPTDAHKYINSILDKLAGEIRGIEIQAERKKPARR